MILLVLCKGIFLGAVMPNKVVGCQLGLRDFVEDQGKLVIVSNSLALITIAARVCGFLELDTTHRMVHQILSNSLDVDLAFNA